LAEAYAKDGQKQQAIANYRKSLELDPKNQNAANKLKELEQK
jgi:Flp pilus assembly protein TadD